MSYRVSAGFRQAAPRRSHLPGRAPPPGSCGAKPPLPRGCVPTGWGERERSSPGAAAAARRRWPGLGAAPPADRALGGTDRACFRPAQQPPSAPPRRAPVAAERPRRASRTAGPFSGARRRLPRGTGRSRRSAAAMLSVFRSIPTQMVGPARASAPGHCGDTAGAGFSVPCATPVYGARLGGCRMNPCNSGFDLRVGTVTL